jgi:hypothetical protein
MDKIYIKMKLAFDEDTGNLQIGDKQVFVRVFEPGQEVFDDTLNQYHQFPGVATEIVFPQLSMGSVVNVHTATGTYSGTLTDTCFNYHVCNQRFVFGTLPALKVPDDVRPHLRVGAPITSADHRLVSVVTAVHKCADGSWLVPVTGVREPSLVSGHVYVRNGVHIEHWRTGHSIYGTLQLPYTELKAHALAQKPPPADALDSCMLFYNESEVRITINKGDFELQHWRMPGPCIINK